MRSPSSFEKTFLKLILFFALAIAFTAPSMSAFAQRPRINPPFFVPYKMIGNIEAAREFVINGSQDSAVIQDGSTYYAAKGPFQSEEEAKSALYALTVQDRSVGICRRYQIGRAVPDGQFYVPRAANIPLYYAFYNIVTFQEQACPPSQAARAGITLASHSDLRRIYIDENSIREDGEWRRVDILTEFDFKNSIKNISQTLSSGYWSMRETFIYKCPIEENDYILKSGSRYYSEPWESGIIVKEYNQTRAELSSDQKRKKILSYACHVPASQEDFADLESFNSIIRAKRISDEREAATQAILDARNARESARERAISDRNRLLKELGPHEYYVEIKCDLGNGYGPKFKTASEAEAWRLGRLYASQRGREGAQDCWVSKVWRWD